MKKILLPTDFSKNSWNAIQYALHLFKNEICHFYLLNTYTPIIYQLDNMQLGSGQFGLLDSIEETSRKGLNGIQQKIENEFKNPNHTFDQVSSFNALISEINELHDNIVLDFIVMGTKGATGAVEILFGSNTVHVIKNAKCPVLAIPNDFLFETPHEILFPSDYEVDFQDKHIQPIIDIVSSNHSKVNVLNVSFGYDLSEQKERNKKKLETYFKNISNLFHSVGNQTVEEAITAFQSKYKIKLLVMLNNKHSFFENLFFKSTVNQIGFHLNIPFLVIPTK